MRETEGGAPATFRDRRGMDTLGLPGVSSGPSSLWPGTCLRGGRMVHTDRREAGQMDPERRHSLHGLHTATITYAGTAFPPGHTGLGSYIRGWATATREALGAHVGNPGRGGQEQGGAE